MATLWNANKVLRDANLIMEIDYGSQRSRVSDGSAKSLVDIDHTGYTTTLSWEGAAPTFRDGMYPIYNGTDNYGIFSRNFLDQADLTKNILTTTNLEEYAMEAWVYLDANVPGDTTSGWQIMGNDGALGIGIQLMRNGALNKVNFGYRSNSNFYCDTCDLTTGQWWHVMGTRRDISGTMTAEIFINGVLDGTLTGATVMDIDGTTDAMHTGRTASRITGWFAGSYGILRLYNRGLTAAEVKLNFDAQKHRFGY